MNPGEIVDRIKTQLEAEGTVWPCHVNRASELGHPCLRYLVYCRVAWEQRTPPDPTLSIIFRDGRMHEDDIVALLKQAGFQFVEQQRPFVWEEYQISGHIDGKLLLDGEAVPVEIKSVNPHTFNSIYTQADLFDPKRPWVTKWGGQLQLYILMDEKEMALLILKCKSPQGQFPIKVIPIYMDWDLGEELLQKAEKVNVAVREYAEKGEDALPDRHEPDEKVCGYCPFLHVCMRARQWGPELLILDDEELTALLERREELGEASREYKAVDEKAKTVIKNRGENLIVGEFHCTVKEDSAGRQRVKIERVGEEEAVPA